MREALIILIYTTGLIAIIVGGARFLGRYLEKRGKPSGSAASAAAALDASHDSGGGDGGS